MLSAAGLLLLALAPLLAGCSALLAPRSDLVQTIAAAADHKQASAFDHGDLDSVLQRFVDSQGNVDYAALAADDEPLERYYARLALVSPDNHPEQFPDHDSRLAYWINAYNGAVLLSVMRAGDIASVSDVKVPWYLFYLPKNAGFFYYRELQFGGQAMSLYTLENSIVRARFADPRVHFALNCASAGCPRLPNAAFAAATLQAELDRETTRFFAESRNLMIDHGEKVIRLSQILNWHESDFTTWLTAQGTSSATLIDYVARYAPPDLRIELLGPAHDYRLEFVPYDWRLNARDLKR